MSLLTITKLTESVGAEVIGMNMAARLETAWLRPMLQPLLPALLGSKQPEKRRRFRVDAGVQQPTLPAGDLS